VSIPHSIHHVNLNHRTQYTTQLLTTSILAYSKKWNYENYKAHRTADIWTSREELIAYEKALVLEAEIDNLANEGMGRKDTSVISDAVGGNVPCFNPRNMC